LEKGGGGGQRAQERSRLQNLLLIRKRRKKKMTLWKREGRVWVTSLLFKRGGRGGINKINLM